jgi:glycosyltransferase involved in cell wall biosynthesis
MGRAHEFDTLLESARTLSSREDIVFLFVGGGAKKKMIETYADQHGLRNVIFKPYQPAERLAESLGCGCVHYITLIPDLEGFIVPSKFYGILAAGRPSLFVGDPIGELASIIHSERVGFAFGVGQSEQLTEAIELLAKDADTSVQFGVNARSLFERRFSRERAFERWEAALSEAAQA